jgi:hypothetical protein
MLQVLHVDRVHFSINIDMSEYVLDTLNEL